MTNAQIDMIRQALDYHSDLLLQDPQWAMLHQLATEELDRRGWQPIASAPTSQPVLVYYAAWRTMMTAERDDHGWSVSGLSESINLQPPTDWMPLPTPPETA